MPDFVTYGQTTAQKKRAFRAVAPRDMSGFTATGEVYSESWEGPYDAMVAMAQAELASPNFPTGKSGQVSVSVDSMGVADLASYSVTRSVYLPNAQLFQDSTTAEAVGKTESCPSYSTEIQEVEAPILTAPVITSKNYDVDTLAALQHISKGGSEYDVIATSSGVASEVVHLLPPDPAIIKIVREQESFLDTRVVHSVSWEVSEVPDLISGAMTIQQPPTAPAVAGRNWLYVGGSLSNDGSVTRATKKYWLSGPGGWSQYYA